MQEQRREGAASEYAFVEYGTLRKKGLRIVFSERSSGYNPGFHTAVQSMMGMPR